MESNFSKDEIRAKVEKLLRLSSSPVEAEAAAAMAKAQELLMRYNLTMAEINPASDEVKEFIRKGTFATFKDEWEGIFALGLSEIFDCYVYNHISYPNGVKTTTIRVYGEPMDVEVMKKIYNKIVPTIKFLYSHAAIQAKSQGLIGHSRGKTLAFKRGWFLGCVHRLIDRLKEQKAYQMAQDNRCTALVIQKQHDASEMFKKDFPKMKDGKPSKLHHDPSAYVKGMHAANAIAINPALNG